MKKIFNLPTTIAFWLVFNVPLGRLAPYVFNFAMGSTGKRIK